MQISLRSQMVAGATALVGASAIALTPVAPAVSIPELSTAKAEVALAALANPVTALIGTGGLVANYLLNGVNTTPSVNWPYSGIGATVDGLRKLYGVEVPGLLPNIILDPLPIATALATNWLGYGFIAGGALLEATGDVADILWSIPATVVEVALDVITLQFDQIIPDVIGAVNGAVNSAVSAFNAVIDGAVTIVGSILAKGTGVLEYLVNAAPKLVSAVIGQLGVIAGGVVKTFESIVAGLSAPNPIEGVWNAAVTGLLSPAGLPGVVVNITQGAGVQTNPANPATFVPSVRTALTAPINGVADVLNGKIPPPLPGAATEAPAPAEVSAASARADVAPAAVEAPAADATAGADAPSAATARAASGETAAPAATAAPEASVAGDNDAAAAKADEPAPAKGKAAAHKGGRS